MYSEVVEECERRVIRWTSLGAHVIMVNQQQPLVNKNKASEGSFLSGIKKWN